MPAFLIGIADRVRDVGITRNRVFNRMSRDPDRDIGVVPINDPATVLVAPEPESGVVELSRTPLCTTALLDESTRSPLQGEKRRSRIGPDLDRLRPKEPYFTVIGNDRDQIIR